jgi:hypothetical protein
MELKASLRTPAGGCRFVLSLIAMQVNFADGPLAPSGSAAEAPCASAYFAVVSNRSYAPWNNGGGLVDHGVRDFLLA